MPRGWERGRGTQGPAWQTREALAAIGVDVDTEADTQDQGQEQNDCE